MTAREFMNTYEGFDFENGKVVLVFDNTPYILTESWLVVLDQHLDRDLRNWTHDEDTIVLIVK